MGELIIRKIGNSVRAIFPKEWLLNEGDVVEYSIDGSKIILDTEDLKKTRDREITEESFADFEGSLYLTEKEIAEELQGYRWGK